MAVETMRHQLIGNCVAILLATSCANQVVAQKPASSSGTCQPEQPGSLIAHPNAKPAANKPIVLESFAIKLVEAKYVEGACVEAIAWFNNGQATLSTGDRLVIRSDGAIEHYPSTLSDRPVLSGTVVHDLPGYVLVAADSVWKWRTTAGNREAYVGTFKGNSDYIIARFDIVNGRSANRSEPLIRSKLPVSSVDFFPAIDTADGRIGFIQRAGNGKAWLYSFDWHYGQLSPLGI